MEGHRRDFEIRRGFEVGARPFVSVSHAAAYISFPTCQLLCKPRDCEVRPSDLNRLEPVTVAVSATVLSDTLSSLFLSPSNPGKLIWGVGPVFTVPSASDPILGTGKVLRTQVSF
jgi:hypothetical protein